MTLFHAEKMAKFRNDLLQDFKHCLSSALLEFYKEHGWGGLFLFNCLFPISSVQTLFYSS